MGHHITNPNNTNSPSPAACMARSNFGCSSVANCPHSVTRIGPLSATKKLTTSFLSPCNCPQNCCLNNRDRLALFLRQRKQICFNTQGNPSNWVPFNDPPGSPHPLPLKAGTLLLFCIRIIFRLGSFGGVGVGEDLDVSENSGTPKSSSLIGVFHYKPSILEYPYFWKHPFAEKMCWSRLWSMLIGDAGVDFAT